MVDNDYHPGSDKLIPDPRIDLKEPLERVVSRIMNDSGPDDGTWNSILILLFNHIDLLSILYTGDSSRANRAKRLVGFIRTYLGRVDEKYAMAGGFIYYMLGNGHVHESCPGSFTMGDGRMLKVTFSGTQESQKHLSVVQSDNELRLIFRVDMFYQDLLDAIELYCLDMSTDRSLLEKNRLARVKLTEPEDRIKIRNHAYILESDFGFINDQIM